MPAKYSILLSTRAIKELSDLYDLYSRRGDGQIITDLDNLSYNFLENRAESGYQISGSTAYVMTFRCRHPPNALGVLKVKYDLNLLSAEVRVLSYQDTP